MYGRQSRSQINCGCVQFCVVVLGVVHFKAVSNYGATRPKWCLLRWDIFGIVPIKNSFYWVFFLCLHFFLYWVLSCCLIGLIIILFIKFEVFVLGGSPDWDFYLMPCQCSSDPPWMHFILPFCCPCGPAVVQLWLLLILQQSVQLQQTSQQLYFSPLLVTYNVEQKKCMHWWLESLRVPVPWIVRHLWPASCGPNHHLDLVMARHWI